MTPTVNHVLSRLRMRQLGLIIALDFHRSLRKAAMDLSMTQSAASKALMEIEDVMGDALFIRSRTGIVPNELGRCVIRYAWLLRADVESMCQEVADIRMGRGGRLSVGAIMGSIPNVLADAIAELRLTVPEVSFHIVEDTSARLLTMLDQGQLDLVIGRALVSPTPALYRYQALQQEPLRVVVGKGHRLAKSRKVCFQDLAPYKWIVYPSRMPLRALLEREIAEAGMAMPTNVIETASAFTTVALLQRCPDLVALLPTEVCDFFSSGRMLRILPIPLSTPGQPFGIVTRASGQPSAVAARLIEVLLANSLAAR